MCTIMFHVIRVSHSLISVDQTCRPAFSAPSRVSTVLDTDTDQAASSLAEQWPSSFEFIHCWSFILIRSLMTSSAKST